MRPRSLIYLGLALLAGFMTYRISHDGGLLFDVTPVFAGHCDPVPGVTGGEDMSIDRASGLLYISSDDRWATIAGTPRQGAIYGLDTRQPDAVPQVLTADLPFSFHPHGLSLYRVDDHEALLMVVNHRDDGSEWVEVFAVQGLAPLRHLQSITYPELVSPNDLVATGRNTFYATSDHGFARGNPLQRVEDYLGLPLASVTYYDGQRGSVVAEGLRYANGITIAPDGKTLYVAEVIARRLRVFDIGAQPGSLTERDRIAVGSGLDNLEWGDDGRLWTGAHPRPFAFLAHAADPEALSPSHVLAIDPAGPTLETIYLGDGSELSGSSVATVSGRTLFIGPVFEHHLLRCQMN